MTKLCKLGTVRVWWHWPRPWHCGRVLGHDYLLGPLILVWSDRIGGGRYT